MTDNEVLIRKPEPQQIQENLSPPPKQRLLCLDVLRGLTMIGMLLVNNQGDYAFAIWPLSESEWNGLSTADMVFPSFLFMTGMSIQLALKPEQASDWKTWARIVRRVFLLFFFGFFINLLSVKFNFNEVRIMAVLQRISICYFIVACLRLLVEKQTHQLMIMSFFPTLYVGLMYGINVPDCGKGNLTEECNFGAYIDEKVFTIKHMLEVNDPEGIITTLDSIFNTFIGMEFMRIFQKFKSKSKELLTNWLILSIYLIIMSLLALIWTPFNKKIWSPSFMLATSGISGLALVICFLVFDYYKNFITEKIKWPLVWMGMNPLFVYIAQEFLEAILINIVTVNYNGEEISAQMWMNNVIFKSWMHYGWLAANGVAILYVVVFTLITKVMYDHQVFIKL